MKILQYAKEESEILQLHVVRSHNQELLDCNKLSEEIFTTRPDIIRMKIAMTDSNIFNNIRNVGIPYNLFSFLIRKSTHQVGAIDFRVPELTFRKYEKSGEEDLRDVLNNLLVHNTGIYYTNNYYKQLIDEDKMLKAGMDYFINLANSDQSAHFYLGYIKGACVGMCSFRLENNIAEGIFFGVKTAYRNLGLAHEFLTYAKQQCFLLGAKEFCTDTLIQNPNSLYPQMNIGLIPQKTFINVVFFPLLSKTPDHEESFLAESFSDILEYLDKNTDDMTIKNISTIHRYDKSIFPLATTIRRFNISREETLICVIGKDIPFWTYLSLSKP